MNTRLTQRELLNCQDAVSNIIHGVQTFSMVAQECNDPELKKVCQDLQAAHQRHYQTIIKHLGGAPQVS